MILSKLKKPAEMRVFKDKGVNKMETKQDQENAFVALMLHYILEEEGCVMVLSHGQILESFLIVPDSEGKGKERRFNQPSGDSISITQ